MPGRFSLFLTPKTGSQVICLAQIGNICRHCHRHTYSWHIRTFHITDTKFHFSVINHSDRHGGASNFNDQAI